MRPKIQFHILSWFTLLGFPAIGFLLLWFFDDYTFSDFIVSLELDKIWEPINLVGIELGLAYGVLVLALSEAPIFDKLSSQQVRVLKSLKLNIFDAIFVAFCAGFGEEILFRVALQSWFGPWLTTIIFLALHGYLTPFSFKKNILGVTLLPFILIISYSYIHIGFWFAVAAHFSYDLLMFLAVIFDSEKKL